MPFFILDARIAPKYFKNDVAQGIHALWPDLQRLRDERFYVSSVGFVTERLRFVYTLAPKMRPSLPEAQTWCATRAAAQQKLLPTPGQSWQHRAFFAHALFNQASSLPFCDRPLSRCDNPSTPFTLGKRR
ncbi:hypothetical protein [Pseudomonas syringae]|uniref:Uncharacterized protein n=1 Tax=Pseudomonas syringae TaxID=317 RepID=A0A9Q4A6B4_PSESX|nr:hypothetical protein [Pseudomonas syringae]MCF5470761.1 hypothetical protein [Pseudomonas syringae]MCF5475955.1 hypothetical protein [Pseudomonas syringae]MCF5485841.1 hypothetical protein [Pseudomonas syringae]MCF5490661.1 hypothetical protein [Pseudomonas syringae]MCF5495218.1 hypothetical protein [Pseudomonas syringae]